MDTLKIAGTDDTPTVTLNKADAIFELSGRSLPEDALAFYDPIFQWLKVYGAAPNASTTFTFKLDYFNTASSKVILDLLYLLKDIKGMRILWYSEEDDEEILDAGKEYAEQVDVPFEFKTLAR
ncbi:MAG TPA: DUF1987 domain-containing protein [Ohtaekwangia sp.]|uniref:DUF1987 domain-containing protein n=1 Tax=Ohtaekwangia sp. TaxID=2066019 RepID=UPI002F94088A